MSRVEGFLYYPCVMTPTPPTPAAEARALPSSPQESAEARAMRAPQQERGQRRVEQILDAAEAVFAEMGVDGASMQAVADRAGASVGSLYHFFPSKDVLVEALARRYGDRVCRTNEAAMPLEFAHLPAEELFERVLSAQLRFIEATPAFGAMQDAIHRNCPAVKDAINNELVGHVSKFLALRYPRLPGQQRVISAMTSVATVHALMHLAAQVPPGTREQVVAEAKRMLVAHYTAYDSAR